MCYNGQMERVCRPRCRYIVFLGIFLFLSASSYASTIAVLPFKGNQNSQAFKSVWDSLNQKGTRHNIVTPGKVIGYLNSSSDGDKVANQEAQKLFETGKSLYQSLQFKESAEALKKSKQLYFSNVYDLSTLEGIRGVKLYLALVYLALQQNELATQELKELLVIDPLRQTRTLSTTDYSPQIVDFFSKVQKETLAAKKGSLNIQCPNSDCVVYVDGEKVSSSVEIKDLPEGEHLVLIRAPGYQPYQTRKYIAGGVNQLSPDLKASRSSKSIDFLTIEDPRQNVEHERAAYLDEMGIQLNVDIFVFLRAGNAKVRGQLYDQRSQELSRVVEGAAPDDLANKLLALVDSQGYVMSRKTTSNNSQGIAVKSVPKRLQPAQIQGSVVQKAPAPKYKKKWTKSPWFWAGVGGVVAAAVITVFVVGQSSEDASVSDIRVNFP